MKSKLLIAVLSMILLSSCASNQKHVPRHASYTSVSFGLVLNTEEVVIGGTQTGIGSYVGSAAAIHDSTSHSFLGLVLRGLVGGIVGAAAEEAVTRSKGMLYTVETTNGLIIQVASKNLELGKGSCVMIAHGGYNHTDVESADQYRCQSIPTAAAAAI